jgi:hypothetical protein
MACWKDRKWIGKIQSFEPKAKAARGGGSHIIGWLDWAKSQQFELLQAWAGCELTVITVAVPPMTAKARRAMSKSFFMPISSKKGGEPKAQQFWPPQAAVLPG